MNKTLNYNQASVRPHSIWLMISKTQKKKKICVQIEKNGVEHILLTCELTVERTSEQANE